jgi:hypothetical protein
MYRDNYIGTFTEVCGEGVKRRPYCRHTNIIIFIIFTKKVKRVDAG